MSKNQPVRIAALIIGGWKSSCSACCANISPLDLKSCPDCAALFVAATSADVADGWDWCEEQRPDLPCVNFFAHCQLGRDAPAAALAEEENE